MRLKKLLAAVSLSIGVAAMSGSAVAATITNTQGSFSPFGGFDWDSAGFAWTQGFDETSDFALHFGSWAASVKETGGLAFDLIGLDSVANGIATRQYEYTVYARLDESVSNCDADSCDLTVNGGIFEIWYDVGQDANASAGSGFRNGIQIIGGTFNAGPTTTFDNNLGGQADLTGLVTFTNAAFINPALAGTIVSSTLQLVPTGVTFPAVFDATGLNLATNCRTSENPTGNICLQADANQTFTTAIPEPATIGLLGIALAGLGLSRRRRSELRP